ncbi:MAG: ribose-phosphate diphosphokinase [bacterium]|nr:ribose-phosphate diphosphokinase [bacterium]
MDIADRKEMRIFSGSHNLELAEEVAELLGVSLGRLNKSTFSSGELYARVGESVRGFDCFVLQSHSFPINDAVMEQLIIIDALRRASARRITAVMPYYGYCRQDKKVLPREPITARLMGDLYMAAGADRLVSVDLHTGQLQGFITKPFDHLTAIPIISEYLSTVTSGDVTIVSPDAGGGKRAEKYARQLDADVALVYKRRDDHVHNYSEALAVTGEVEGRHAVIVDDIIDTAGTVCNAAELIRDMGAASVRIAATHAVLSHPAVKRLSESGVDEIVVTNTLPVPAADQINNLKVLSIASIVAKSVHAIFTEGSVSQIFLGENA